MMRTACATLLKRWHMSQAALETVSGDNAGFSSLAGSSTASGCATACACCGSVASASSLRSGGREMTGAENEGHVRTTMIGRRPRF